MVLAWGRPEPSHGTMPREMCYRCFWPKGLCWCPSLEPIETRASFVFLMHPKEFKQEKAGTGRLTHLCLPNSTLHVGMGFDADEDVQVRLSDPRYHAALLYPGPSAANLSDLAGPNGQPGTFLESLGSRKLRIVILDGTWSGARKMLRMSPTLQRLPRVMFRSPGRSRFLIKQQPQDGCLSTLEATHEILCLLEKAGLEAYERRDQLLGILERMQRYQIACAADPGRGGYRHRPYTPPALRSRSSGRSGRRRENFLSCARVAPGAGEALPGDLHAV